jgi:hypothetical protein
VFLTFAGNDVRRTGYNWSTTAGDPIRQYTATGATNQQFSLVRVGATCGADTVLADIAAASVD